MTDSAELTTALEELVAGTTANTPVLIASDFDGVLAPLVDDPAQSRPLPVASAALQRLAAGHAGVHVALVSGRDLNTLVTLAAPPAGTQLIGSHGAELGHIETGTAGHENQLVHTPLELSPTQREQLTQLAAGLEEIAASAQGAWVEHKPAAAVLHTRLAAPELAAKAFDRAKELGEQVGVNGLAGKNVLEFAVVSTTKGIALTALQQRLGAECVFYMGDDVTDEHAFEKLQPTDLTIRIGPGDTLARFRIADPEAAAELLTALADAFEGHSFITG